jgi:hypothetical protein
MNCTDFEKTVLLLANDRLIEVGRRAEALRHTETCARCAARLGAECSLVSGVRAVRAEIANEQAPVHLETLLVNAFRESAMEIAPMLQNGRATARQSGQGCPPSERRSRSHPRSKWSWANWKVAAVAAAILLLTSAGAIVFVRSISTTEISTTSIAPVIVPDWSAPIPKVPEPPDRVVEVRTPRRTTGHRAQQAETVTEYFPLIEGEDLDSVEFAQVVRVELSASALREVGLPLSYASAGEPVKADVVLGPDGMARAIRFVR